MATARVSLLDGGDIYGYNQVKMRYVKENLDDAT
jgi:hypothetical protein